MARFGRIILADATLGGAVECPLTASPAINGDLPTRDASFPYNSPMRKVVRTVRAVVAGVLLSAMLFPLAAKSPPDTATMDDEQFLSYLDAGTSDDGQHGPALDQRRLAKLLFSIGATLGGGKSNVRLLLGAMRVRDPAAESTREMALARYRHYDEAAESFRNASSRLLDSPESVPKLFRVLVDGQEVCWRLDAFTRLMETYGVSANEMLSILSSREACGQFRRAAFSTPVKGAVVRSLEDAERLRSEMYDLRREIEELEKLVQDLDDIEGR